MPKRPCKFRISRWVIQSIHWGTHWGVMTCSQSRDSHPNTQARQANTNTAYETFSDLLQMYREDLVQR
jgi:hypothetical protein